MNPLAGLLLALAAAPLAALPGAQDPPSPERVEAALVALEAAFPPKGKQSLEVRQEALLEHGWIDDERVIVKVVTTLYDNDLPVRILAVEALGGMTSKRSLLALSKYFERRHHKTRLDVEIWPRLFQELGRRGDPLAIPTLLIDVRGQMAARTLRARLFALASIRDAESIEGVLSVLEDLDDFHRVRSLPDARIALLVLTGQELEGSAEDLREWWNRSREEFVLPPSPPRLEGEAWQAWRGFWQLPEREASEQEE